MKTKNELIDSVLAFAAGMLAVTFLLTSVGCGSTQVATHTSINASAGQQLMDLKKARDENLVSDQEYQKLRDAIIKRSQ